MPKCPNCQAEIDYLINIQSGWFAWKFDGNNFERLEELEDVDDNVNYFACPECREELFYSYEKAIKFLNGGKNE
jgi:hypothetical protein